MKKKFYFLSFGLVLVFGIFIYRVGYLAYTKHDYYLARYNSLNEIYVTGSSAPRGRILDINGKVLVDNIGINRIMYHKQSGVTVEEEIEIAKRLAKLTNYEYKYDEDKLKEYYLVINREERNKLITDEEKKAYNERKISKDDMEKLRLDRISDEMINSLTEEEKYSSYFYYLMTNGYYYDNKVILKEVDDSLYASILESDLKGIFGEVDWSRKYMYNDTLKSIFGEISNVLPSDKKELLNKGYDYLDKVGISGLEEYYEDALKGEKAVYKLNNNTLELVKKAKRGKDITLNIDIDMQLKVEEIIKDNILKAKKTPNTEYYRESFALISEAKTGGMKVIAGVRLMDNGEFQDISINVIKNAYTVGSVVKGASMSVGYKNGAIDIGTTMWDSCVKLYNVPQKCSFKSLGKLDDIRALAMSSNYYQFITALKVAGYNYTYDMKAPVTIEDFNKYRDVFKSYGLGSSTGIDLPGELSGLEGSKIAPDLLLNLAIGQYDLYTATSLLQYTNTLANDGVRLKLNIVNKIGSDEIKKTEELNRVDLDSKYIARIKEGFHSVIKSGLGYGYADVSVDGAGKTGTSESYIDSNYDGVLDAYVISNTFLMFAPFDNPKYSMVVISPNVSNINGKSDYSSPVNRLIARGINDFLFSNE